MIHRNIVIVTDAWLPQVNGVVRTLQHLVTELRARGRRVDLVTPADYRSMPCPTYPEIRLALARPAAIKARIEALQPAFVHIATEGPLGIMARAACLSHGWSFTTGFHTRFPEYLRERLPVPLRLSYAWLKWFHNAASHCLVPTASMEGELRRRGFANLRVWTRGVDRSLFRPQPEADLGLPRPVFGYVGRLAVEKNVDAFLALDLPGSKLVVGDGPARADLERRFPDAYFVGTKLGEDLAYHYAAADAFVFPSRTDTFGLVLLEAIACGLPVAAFPVPGPLDVIGATRAGVLDDDLRRAALAALALGRIDPDAALSEFTWESCADIFEEILTPIGELLAGGLPALRSA